MHTHMWSSTLAYLFQLKHSLFLCIFSFTFVQIVHIDFNDYNILVLFGRSVYMPLRVQF